MNCIFCKKDSSTSKSREHIIPESLWNPDQVLPAGIVCDECNNYFSIKVEKPFLCSSEMNALRFRYAIPNKKGRIPPVQGVVPGVQKPINVYKSTEDSSLSLIFEDGDAGRVLKAGRLFIPHPAKWFENNKTSRFLAKVALEALAQRFQKDDDELDYIVQENQFDEIRNHARFGKPAHWPYKSRTIYDPDDAGGEGCQMVHEYDFLYTEHLELYFVLALYGVELTINMGGADMEGYENWLKENDNKSPLYHGKNTAASHRFHSIADSARRSGQSTSRSE